MLSRVCKAEVRGSRSFGFHKVAALRGKIMKKVMLAVLPATVVLFLVLPNLSWAQADLYKARRAACHEAGGEAAPPEGRWEPCVFVRQGSEGVGCRARRFHRAWRVPEEGLPHAFSSKGVTAADAEKLAAYVKT